MTGPLHGVKLLEFAGIGPAPFATMLFADMGAEVVRIERKGAARRSLSLLNLGPLDITGRGRRAMGLDIKRSGGKAAALRLIAQADGLIEGYRPGVMERLGLGPDPCLALNPRLVYGRMTGWGQDGPLSKSAGHDLTYIAISSALHGIGTPDQPLPPLNLVGDYGGGGLVLAWGMLCALWRRAFRIRARSWTRPWSTARPCSCLCSTVSEKPAYGATNGAPICSTAAHLSMAPMPAPTANMWPLALSSPTSMRCCLKSWAQTIRR